MVIEGEGLQKSDTVCSSSWRLKLNSQGVHAIFTYSVRWVKSETSWANRFDLYNNSEFAKETKKIHWYSIINSLLVMLFLTVGDDGDDDW